MLFLKLVKVYIWQQFISIANILFLKLQLIIISL